MSFELADLSENNREFDEDEHDNILRKADKILESEKLLNNGNNNSSGDDEIKENDERAQIFNLKSIAIPIFYFTLGFLLRFPSLPLRLYLRNTIGATPGQQAVVFAVVMGMPWNLKVFIGFFSDTVPIRGQRRKPYMFFGTILCTTSWLLFGLYPSEKAPIGIVCLLLFFAVLGMIIADVMSDALVVERVKFEKKKGGIQSVVWMLRFFGGFCGYLSSGWLMEYGNVHPKTIFFITGFVPLVTLLPSVYFLEDQRVLVKGTQKEESLEKLWILWDTLQSPYIWKPMVFIYIFASGPNAGDAFSNFLLGPLGFTESTYSYLLTIGMLSQMAGAFIYRKYLSDVNWHKLFCITLLVGSCLSATQLILVSRLNVKWGIPDIVFAFGDEIINDTVAFIIQMPTLVMCAALCPKGIEGVLYALMVCVNNIALSVGGAVSGALTDSLGITNTNFEKLFELVLIASLATLLPILFLPCVPKDAKECEEAAKELEAENNFDETLMQGRPRGSSDADRSNNNTNRKKKGQKSKWGGGLLVFLLVAGLIFSISDTAYKLSYKDDED